MICPAELDSYPWSFGGRREYRQATTFGDTPACQPTKPNGALALHAVLKSGRRNICRSPEAGDKVEALYHEEETWYPVPWQDFSSAQNRNPARGHLLLAAILFGLVAAISKPIWALSC